MMPTYVYRCRTCEHQLEVQQRMADAPFTTCPDCLGLTLERQITSGNPFLLRGAGWSKSAHSHHN